MVACARRRSVPPTTQDLFGARPRALAPHSDRVPPSSSSHTATAAEGAIGGVWRAAATSRGGFARVN